MQHSFDVDIAKEYGILEAILLNNIWYWIEKNKANEVNFYDGFYWTYNSTRAFNQLFPYVSQRQIQNALKKLKEQELIQTGNYNKIAYDRTLWYAFTKKGECIMQKCKMDYADLLNGIDKNAQPIPNNKPNSKQYIFIPSDEGALFDPEDTTTITMPTPAEHTNSKGARNKNVTSEQVEEWFEDLWLMYERKGSKANAKKEFAKLTEEEVELMRLHIPAYIQSRPERQYRQDFERYIKHKTFNSVVYSKSNDMLYDPEARNTSATQETPAEFRREDETFTMNGITYR